LPSVFDTDDQPRAKTIGDKSKESIAVNKSVKASTIKSGSALFSKIITNLKKEIQTKCVCVFTYVFFDLSADLGGEVGLSHLLGHALPFKVSVI
jgi:hypothetical protein